MKAERGTVQGEWDWTLNKEERRMEGGDGNEGKAIIILMVYSFSQFFITCAPHASVEIIKLVAIAGR